MTFVNQLTKPRDRQQLRSALVVQDTKGKRLVNLDKNIYSLGRDSRNSIVLHSQLVSRHHATLLRVCNTENNICLFQIIDGDLQGNSSTNGLIVNGKPCLSQTLQPNDLIIFGGDAEARYLVIDENTSSAEIFEYCESDNLFDGTTASFDPLSTVVPSDIQFEPLSDAALLRLASFPELLPSPIIEIDIHGKITYLNPAALLKLPEIQEELLQHPTLAGLLDAVQNEKKQFFVRNVKVGLTIFEQSVYYIGESRLIRSYLVDITERKQKEEELRQYRENLEQIVEERTGSLKKINKKLQQEINYRLQAESALLQQLLAFQNIYDGIIITDLQGQITEWNPGAQRMFGYSKKEVLGKSLSMLLTKEKSAIFDTQIIDGIMRDGRWASELYFIRKDETEGVCETIVVPWYDESGEMVAAIGVNHDITERKQAELEIRKALEKEKELNELRSRFVTMASHEFRTPLATILSSSDLLKAFSHKFSDEKKLQHLNKIQAQVKHMTQLLEDVLFIGKVTADRIKFNPVNLNLEAFCREFVEEIELTIASKHNFIFNCQGECSLVEMDEKLLRQMLNHLLSNAVKYSPEGSTVQLHLFCDRGQAMLQIRDEGIGIPEADWERVFEVFHRGSNISNISGTGLGMAITKKAVELHGGSITFNSVVGGGTTFTVCLPMHQV